MNLVRIKIEESSYLKMCKNCLLLKMDGNVDLILKNLDNLKTISTKNPLRVRVEYEIKSLFSRGVMKIEVEGNSLRQVESLIRKAMGVQFNKE